MQKQRGFPRCRFEDGLNVPDQPKTRLKIVSTCLVW